MRNPHDSMNEAIRATARRNTFSLFPDYVARRNEIESETDTNDQPERHAEGSGDGGARIADTRNSPNKRSARTLDTNDLIRRAAGR